MFSNDGLIFTQTQTTSSWPALLENIGTSPQKNIAKQLLSKVFSTHSYQPQGQDLENLAVILTLEEGLQHLSRLVALPSFEARFQLVMPQILALREAFSERALILLTFFETCQKLPLLRISEDFFIKALNSNLHTVQEISTELLPKEFAAIVTTLKPTLIGYQTRLEEIFNELDYVAPQTKKILKQIELLLESPRHLSADEIRFVIYASSNAQKAREMIVALRPRRITEAHAYSIKGRKNLDTLSDFILMAIKEQTTFLSPERLTRLFAYPEWESLAFAVNFFRREGLPQLLWHNLDQLLLTDPKDLYAALKDIKHDYYRHDDDDNIIAIAPPPMIAFRAETEESKRHDYAHQEAFNKGIQQTIDNFKDLYLEKITTLSHKNALLQKMRNWAQELPSTQKFAVLRAFDSITVVSQISELYAIELNDFLLLCWCALHDPKQHEENISQQEAYDFFITTISDIKPGLCLDGHYKKLAEALTYSHLKAVQSGLTLELLIQKLPIMVKEQATSYLKQIPFNEGLELYDHIQHAGLALLFPLIKEPLNQAILDEFAEVAPQGLDTPKVALFLQYLNDIDLNIPKFEKGHHKAQP